MPLPPWKYALEPKPCSPFTFNFNKDDISAEDKAVSSTLTLSHTHMCQKTGTRECGNKKHFLLVFLVNAVILHYLPAKGSHKILEIIVSQKQKGALCHLFSKTYLLFPHLIFKHSSKSNLCLRGLGRLIWTGVILEVLLCLHTSKPGTGIHHVSI